jgi:beta-carotene 3-hydroxylase
MSFIAYIAIALGTFILMEGFSWCLHRYVMHGFLWYLHKDHHQKSPGIFEKNDYFFLIFAIPSWLCIMLGVIYKTYWVIALGAGFTLYGIAYFLVHEVIIHQRIKWFSRSNNKYIRGVRWAHKMHHKHLDRFNGESFGMLWVAKKYWDKIKSDMKKSQK